MNNIPTIWFWLSGAFFVVNILFFFALTVALLRVAGLIKELTPKVNELSVKVNGLVTQVQEVAKKVEEVAANVATTMSEVGGRAKGVVGSVELVAQSASRQFERFSPFVVGAITAMRLVRALSDIRGGRKPSEALKKRNMKRKPARGGIMGLFGR
jgi:outer membrane murein-binding lipoprotein Lpp